MMQLVYLNPPVGGLKFVPQKTTRSVFGLNCDTRLEGLGMNPSEFSVLGVARADL